ncbi:dehydrogenase [Streptomyces spectabilis]|uniref:3-hydroxyisobutyrate dehydrogenase n=1 Tax=Streptomyces spectabilis TaxID=68270 RepID=A0A5P2X424_STRST|nr:NAD(P)-dependent oxidoreductase [Streptomyces spectabilis]MBB5101767.1 3-hydroxyisobutyrate dehydrogenase [Streptomyces spectabilis]MCI3900947.1 NAD(P)-dependent oxidoreductase [Streptomyces spectabilis]QEV58454.1 NAD(P)-dependent oxidoreductase [Streptomyces spectabilis]GGV50054.1 dehydrogenase [Streptomyces spectabilis]
MTRKKVAVLGTGTIGAPVARNLRGTFAVSVWNRTPAKAAALAALDGVEAHTDPAAAVAGADVVVTVLKDGPAVREVMEAAAPGLAPGAVWAQLSTVGVAAADDLAAVAERHGLVLYDAPVQGTKQPAEQGRLVVLASGPPADRNRVEPVFDAIGSRTVWVSDEHGAASRLKLALNSFVFALTHGAAESLALAEGLGVDPALVVDVVAGGPLDSPFFRAKAAAMLAGDHTPSFTVTNAAKDARLVVEAAGAAGVPVDVTAAGLRRFERAAAAGYGDQDMAASHLAPDAVA